jgi:hypothetical protein
VEPETAGIVTALISYQSDDFQCLGTLLGWYRHPNGCEDHMLLPFIL